jgi:hypothetical protein
MQYIINSVRQHGGWPHPCQPPSATWARHLHPYWAQIIDKKKVWKHVLEPKIFKVRYILLTTKLHFYLWLYSVFIIVILIIYYYNI